MIHRINFIEKESLQITYGTLLISFGVAFAVCLLLFLAALLGTIRAKSNVRHLSADITKLKQQREALLQQEEIIQGNQAFMTIHTLLKKEPSWSQLFQGISASLPSNVWLVSFKSADKEDSPSKKGLLLNGLAKKPQSLALFLTALEKIPQFEKVVLTSSKEENGLFNFSVSCDISSGSKR